MKSAPLSSILLLLQSTTTLAIVMASDTPGSAPVEKRNGDTGPVTITLWTSGDNTQPNLNCDDSDLELGVTCDDIPFNECCFGVEDGELFDSANHNQARGWRKLGVYAGVADPCETVIQEKKKFCLAGSPSGMSITGAIVKGPSGRKKREDGSVEGPKPRGVRANKYTVRVRDTDYHVDIDSPLGEQYRNLTSIEAKRDFMLKHGEPRPTLNKRWLEKQAREASEASEAGH
ncbi:hypothetical protein MFIFM68171_07079 [Madurella fahalii]|uniref:Uncharacterized protein n=1 Tax=Madurella fahalii TaxID=1157608 RepID=A0ABQ0GGI2_9PEZI